MNEMKRRWRWSTLLLLCAGCSHTEYLVAKPASYGYVTQRAAVKALWPDASGKLVEAEGTLPPGTVILVPKDGGPSTQP